MVILEARLMEDCNCLKLDAPPLHPLLAGLLSVVPLKSKLVSTVLGPWFVDT